MNKTISTSKNMLVQQLSDSNDNSYFDYMHRRGRSDVANTRNIRMQKSSFTLQTKPSECDINGYTLKDALYYFKQN